MINVRLTYQKSLLLYNPLFLTYLIWAGSIELDSAGALVLMLAENFKGIETAAEKAALETKAETTPKNRYIYLLF